MAIYGKPVHQIMKQEMVDELKLKDGKTFTRQQAINWFAHYYPKIKTGTISAHMICLSTNATSRVHYNPKPFEDDVFYQIDRSTFRLYDPDHDPKPIRKGDKPPDDDDQTENDSLGEFTSSSVGSDEFAYESDLKNYLAKNLYIIESGLQLYEEEGIHGIEFPVGGRFIDILAVDSNNDLVVIELKVSRGYDRVAGQLMRYMAWISKNHAEPEQKVRGMIVAREISEDLQLACSLVSNVQLFEYQLSLAVNPVEVSQNSR
ncbi:endonuclease NucS domain-containing protein [Pseudomonadota bacterium]